MNVFAPATREQEVQWNSLLADTLRLINVTPTIAVTNALNALTSYSASPPSIYCDAVSGVRSAKLHSGLLLALHHATAQWPLHLRQMLAPPPVLVADETLSVSGPAMELFVVLYNACISNCELGFTSMARAHTDVARAGTVRPADISHPSPLVSSKSAFKSFTAAAELALLAEQALAEGGDELLSAIDRHSLQKVFEFHSVRELAELCVATAKYVYSTTSGAVSKKHDTLAKLAYAAATTAVPSGLKATSLLLAVMSRLLMVAYHRHMAEHYYRLEKVPDMSLVLGHIMYAVKLLGKIQEECSAVLQAHTKSQKVLSSPPRETVRSVRRLFGQFSATIAGSGGTNAASDAGSKGHCCQSPAELAELLEGGNMMNVFPLAGNLVREVVEQCEKYQHENSVIYYSRPAPEENIRDDVPETKPLEVDNDGVRYSSNREELIEALSRKLDADMSKFDELPSPKDLVTLLDFRETVDDVCHKVEALQGLSADAEQALSIPKFVCFALAELEPLLRPHVDTVGKQESNNEVTSHNPCPLDRCLDATFKAVEQAVSRHVEISKKLYRAKCEYIGEYIKPFDITETLKSRWHSWLKKADQLSTNLKIHLPHRHQEVELHETLLLPEGAKLRASLENAASVVDMVKGAISALESKPVCVGFGRLALGSDHDEPLPTAPEFHKLLHALSEAHASVAAAVERLKPFLDTTRWAHVAGTLHEAVELIKEADDIVKVADVETKEMERQLSRIDVPPIGCLQGVVFKDAKPPTPRMRQGKQADSSRQRTDATATDEQVRDAPDSAAKVTGRRGRKRSHTSVDGENERVEGATWNWPSTVEAESQNESIAAVSPSADVNRAGAKCSAKTVLEGASQSSPGTSMVGSASQQPNIPEAVASPLLKRRLRELTGMSAGGVGEEVREQK